MLIRKGGTVNDNQIMHAMSIDDTYRVERVLARGETGVTELVTIDGAGPFVRKKMEAKPATRRVWAALGACESPRLPHVEASYELPDQFVVVYDYVPGETLETLVAQRGAFTANEAVEAVRGICEACTELHAHGIIHRDITPANVILSVDGAHLIDLGIARMRVEGASKDTTSLGTWGYASPEQYGFAQTDARSDVYSIGRVLGYLLTAVRPDDERFDTELAHACQGEAAWLAHVIERACAFEPSARYQSAEEMAAALTGPDAPTGEPGPAPESAPEPAAGAGDAAEVTLPKGKTGVSRKNAVAAVICIAIVVLAGVLGFLYVGSGFFGESEQSSKTSSSSSAAPRSNSSSSSDSSHAAQDPSDNSDSSSTSGSTESNEGPLELIDSGWSLTQGGYINYAVTIKNTSAKRVLFPVVQITGRDEAGKVVSADTQTLNAIEPGESISYAGYCGGGSSSPASVDFVLEQPSSDDLAEPTVAATFSVSGVSEQRRGNEATFTGEVTTDQDTTGETGAMIAVSVILRDADGQIVGGDTTFVDRPAEGKSTPFQLDLYDVDYAAYEVAAQAW